MTTIVLASTSRYRRDLLARLKIPFVTDDPAVDETLAPREVAAEACARLALAKAQAVAPRHRSALIIACDQLCTLHGQVSGKPGSRSQAIAQLQRACGQIVRFHTALVLIDTESGCTMQQTAENAVAFRQLQPQQIADYVDRDQPFDCAGSFRAEGLGIALFERIEGTDPNALIGLPLIALCGFLEQAGYPVLGRPGATTLG